MTPFADLPHEDQEWLDDLNRRLKLTDEEEYPAELKREHARVAAAYARKRDERLDPVTVATWVIVVAFSIGCWVLAALVLGVWQTVVIMLALVAIALFAARWVR